MCGFREGMWRALHVTCTGFCHSVTPYLSHAAQCALHAGILGHAPIRRGGPIALSGGECGDGPGGLEAGLTKTRGNVGGAELRCEPDYGFKASSLTIGDIAVIDRVLVTFRCFFSPFLSFLFSFFHLTR